MRYGVQGSGQTAIPFVQGEDSAALHLSGLRPGTLYEIQVAAVTSAGTGVYSNSILQMTTGILIIINNYSIYSYRNIGIEVFQMPLKLPLLDWYHLLSMRFKWQQ